MTTTQSMPHLLAGVLTLSVFSGCRNDASEGIGFMNHYANSPAVADDFRTRLTGWLETNSFRSAPDPGSKATRGKIQPSSGKTTWYQGRFAGSAPFMVCISETQSGAEAVLFHGDTFWERNAYESEHQEMRDKIRSFREALLRSLGVARPAGASL